jgi:flavin-dependent dehydrogenase
VFDKMLLDNAVEKGVTARTDAQVLDVLFDGDRATGVRVKLAQDTDRPVREIAAKVIVDATGQSAFLATRLGLKKPDGRLKKGAVWAYFKGARRDKGRDEGAIIVFQTEEKKSWFWYIPLPDDIVSIGVVGSMGYIFDKDRGKPEEVYAQELKRCPALEDRMQNATRVTDFITTKDFTYRATKAAGPGWVLVGDAFGFIDPVYSTGVLLALTSGEFAADAVHDGLEKGDLSAEQLGHWQPKFIEGMELFRKLVYAFYAPDFRFGDFLRAHPQYRENIVHLLSGNVFKPGVGEVFDAMGEILPPLEEDARLPAAGG